MPDQPPSIPPAPSPHPPARRLCPLEDVEACAFQVAELEGQLATAILLRDHAVRHAKAVGHTHRAILAVSHLPAEQLTRILGVAS